MLSALRSGKLGAMNESAALEAPATATSFPFATASERWKTARFPTPKKQLGGFCVIDVENMEQAVKWAQKCPAAKNGHVDVRPVPFLEEGEA